MKYLLGSAISHTNAVPTLTLQKEDAGGHIACLVNAFVVLSHVPLMYLLHLLTCALPVYRSDLCKKNLWQKQDWEFKFFIQQ